MIGGWRDNYRVTGSGKVVMVDGRRMAYHEGKKVDPSDVLPDGQKFANIDEFKQLLLKDKDQLARSLAVKLLIYGTGGGPARTTRRKSKLLWQRLAKRIMAFERWYMK